ncbi:putative UDP-arabinose 4-epimerase 4 [Camellia lanceoleosa]|nr:putative UDP-arabinose 4-epimerase 4 [Camellia lanceoleosa]
MQVTGTDYKTADGTCMRDYIDVTDLVDAHVKALEGNTQSVKEFVEACKKATGVNIKVEQLPRRPGDYAEVFSDPTKIKQVELDSPTPIFKRVCGLHGDGKRSIIMGMERL